MTFYCAFAEEYHIKIDSEVTGKLLNIEGNEAKFNEYRDIRDGLYGSVHLNYDSDFFFDFKASDIGYDTQHYRLDSGKWGSFKYFLQYDEIPHNITYGARSFYSGIGTGDLVGIPNTNINTWSTFDYSIKRKNYTGGVKLDFLKPFYVDISISREEKSGLKPTAAEGGIGFGNMVELPELIDYSTNSLKLEVGYAKNPLFGSLSLFYSVFDNDNEILNFNNPFIPGNPRDLLTLPPDNKYYKVAFKSTVKLPMNSKFNINLGYARTKSDATLLNSYYGDGVLKSVSLSDLVFSGKIDTQNYDFILTSNPVLFLDTKVFYKYYKRKNKSDTITTTDGTETFINPLFGHNKKRYGLELTFRLPARLCLIAAYNHVMEKRDREDVPKNDDNIYSVDLKWNGLDFMNLKVGYEKLHRKAEFHAPDVAQDNPEFIETFVQRFDVASKDRDTYKASIDIYPIENLTFGIGYKNKKTDYKDVTLGLREARGDEININVDYTIGEFMKLAAYWDYEMIQYYQFQRRLPFNATTGFDPATPPAPSTFNWDLKQKDRSFDYGIGADIPIISKKLTLRLQHDYVKSDGTADYTYYLGINPLPAGRTQDNIDISNWDDYRLRAYMVKAIYYVTKKISLSAGYVYEKYTYSDALLDAYQYILGNPPNTYLTGAYKDQEYKANIIFLAVAYRF